MILIHELMQELLDTQFNEDISLLKQSFEKQNINISCFSDKEIKNICTFSNIDSGEFIGIGILKGGKRFLPPEKHKREVLALMQVIYQLSIALGTHILWNGDGKFDEFDGLSKLIHSD